MVGPAAPPHPAPRSALRRLVARHPVAAFLALVYTLYPAFAYAPVLLPWLLRRDGAPLSLVVFSSLGHNFGVALPAVLVLAALHGRAGVRDLARRSCRWRVGLRWYLLAVLALPTAVLLAASALFGLAPLRALGAGWPLLLTAVLPDLLRRALFSNVAEEVGWTGFLQDRLQARHGPLRASVLVTLPFALFHLPDVMLEFGFTPAQLPLALGVVGLLGIAQLFGRVVIMWLYNATRRSVLLVGLFHAAFDSTVAEAGFAGAFIPGQTAVELASGVIALAAVLLVARSRGRLAYRPGGAGGAPGGAEAAPGRDTSADGPPRPPGPSPPPR